MSNEAMGRLSSGLMPFLLALGSAGLVQGQAGVTDTGPMRDGDGNTYPTVRIGAQVWMAENLRTTRFADGSEIPEGGEDEVWKEASSPMWCAWNPAADVGPGWGCFYNFMAVEDERGLCPSGWHVPSDAEWDALEMTLGLIRREAGRPGVDAEVLRSTAADVPGWDGSNASGFKGIPAGYRDSSGTFYHRGEYASWWSSTSDGTAAIDRYLYTGVDVLHRDFNPNGSGFSVRCVQDDELKAQ
jgi:uncharacterized protein (TIGR02145 family)